MPHFPSRPPLIRIQQPTRRLFTPPNPVDEETLDSVRSQWRATTESFKRRAVADCSHPRRERHRGCWDCTKTPLFFARRPRSARSRSFPTSESLHRRSRSHPPGLSGRARSVVGATTRASARAASAARLRATRAGSRRRRRCRRSSSSSSRRWARCDEPLPRPPNLISRCSESHNHNNNPNDVLFRAHAYPAPCPEDTRSTRIR